MIDVRFPTALQMMFTLAAAKDEGIARVSCSELAEGVGANPSFIRQLILPLAESGLIETSHGRDGGVSLLRSADEITLREIYLAMVGTKCLWASRDVPHRCFVSSNFKEYFSLLTDEVQEAMLALLGSKTLADGLSEIRMMHKYSQPAKTISAKNSKRITRSANQPSKGTLHV